MTQTIEKDLLELDDCFPDGIIVDNNITISEVDKVMADFFATLASTPQPQS